MSIETALEVTKIPSFLFAFSPCHKPKLPRKQPFTVTFIAGVLSLIVFVLIKIVELQPSPINPLIATSIQIDSFISHRPIGIFKTFPTQLFSASVVLIDVITSLFFTSTKTISFVSSDVVRSLVNGK